LRAKRGNLALSSVHETQIAASSAEVALGYEGWTPRNDDRGARVILQKGRSKPRHYMCNNSLLLPAKS
jgi:hypothetical protein